MEVEGKANVGVISGLLAATTFSAVAKAVRREERRRHSRRMYLAAMVGGGLYDGRNGNGVNAITDGSFDRPHPI